MKHIINILCSFNSVLLLINIDLNNVIRADLIDFRSADQQFNELWANALAYVSSVA